MIGKSTDRGIGVSGIPKSSNSGPVELDLEQSYFLIMAAALVQILVGWELSVILLRERRCLLLLPGWCILSQECSPG